MMPYPFATGKFIFKSNVFKKVKTRGRSKATDLITRSPEQNFSFAKILNFFGLVQLF